MGPGQDRRRVLDRRPEQKQGGQVRGRAVHREDVVQLRVQDALGRGVLGGERRRTLERRERRVRPRGGEDREDDGVREVFRRAARGERSVGLRAGGTTRHRAEV